MKFIKYSLLFIAILFFLNNQTEAEQTHSDPARQKNVHDNEDSAHEYYLGTLLVMNAIGPIFGMKIIDIGAGYGYFVYKLSPLAGGKGKIYATDIDPEAVQFLKNQVSKRKLSNVEVLLVNSDQIGISPDSADLILIINSYRFDNCPYNFASHILYLMQCHESLHTGGRILINKDWLRTTDWKNPDGDFTDCDDADVYEVADWASILGFDILSLQIFTFQESCVRGQNPGYLLLLQKID